MASSLPYYLFYRVCIRHYKMYINMYGIQDFFAETVHLLLVITWGRWSSLIPSLRCSTVSLLTRLHRGIPLFSSMLTMRYWWWRWWRKSRVLLSNMGRGSITVETTLVGLVLVSARWGVVLVMRRNIYRFVSLHIRCRGDNVECVNDRWDLDMVSTCCCFEFEFGTTEAERMLTQMRNQRICSISRGAIRPSMPGNRNSQS